MRNCLSPLDVGLHSGIPFHVALSRRLSLLCLPFLARHSISGLNTVENIFALSCVVAPKHIPDALDEIPAETVQRNLLN